MKRLLLLMLLLVTAFQGFSQTKGISYQAVILNPNPQEIPGANAQNNILANSAVSIQFTVVNASGTEEYQEQHSTRTDRYGMINLLIGTGSPSSSNDFSDIFWDGTTKKLKVEIDFKGGNSFSPLSEQNLTYMPQPPTEETSQLIVDNASSIAAEVARAGSAEIANANAIIAEADRAGLAEIANANAIAAEATRAGLAEIANAATISTIQGVQTLQNSAIDLKADKESPTFTGDLVFDTNGVSFAGGNVSFDNGQTFIRSAQVFNDAENIFYGPSVEFNNQVTNFNTAANFISGTLSILNSPQVAGYILTDVNGDGHATWQLPNTDAIIAEADRARLAEEANAGAILTHSTSTNNPHSVSQAQIGLGNVNNTSDADKPVSTLTQKALNLKEDTSNKSTNVTLSENSDNLYPSQKAVKVYVDALENELSALRAQTKPKLGDLRDGGIVFWVDESGNHGLVCALSDFENNVEWGCNDTDLLNVSNVDGIEGAADTGTGAEIGDGITNTNNILNDCDTAPAALAARSLGANWFLPSINELNEIYVNRAILEGVNGFTPFSDLYWSSTESNNSLAWHQDFFYGGQFKHNKTISHHIRAVRAFTTGEGMIEEAIADEANRAELAEVTNADAISTHSTSTNNPHAVTKAQIGLGNVDNTSDLSKPVSALTQTALDGKVDKVVGKELSTNDYTTVEKTKLAAIAGVNTGDETATTIKTKLGITTLSGANTGDQTLPTLSSLGAVSGNAAITAGTNTKITYDSKGLVLSGSTLSGGDIPNIGQSQVTDLVSDLSGKQNTLSLTTTGTSGTATLIGSTLNVPQYTGNVGTVTGVSVTSANGVSGTVATSTSTPAISLTLGAITPTSVNSVVMSGSATPTLSVTGTASISNANTGDDADNTQYSGLAAQLSSLQAQIKELIADNSLLETSVAIGTQKWMKKNLDVTNYSDGTPIPQVTDPTAWAALKTGAWCYYNYDANNGTSYGKLYNWYAVMGITTEESATPTPTEIAARKKLAPTGWHVPTDAEWTILTDGLGGTAIAGGAMKETGTTHWTSPNANATNSSGFTGLPGGYRYNYGTFNGIGINGDWWSSTEGGTTTAYIRYLNYLNGYVFSGNANKANGFSVRCLRD